MIGRPDPLGPEPETLPFNGAPKVIEARLLGWLNPMKYDRIDRAYEALKIARTCGIEERYGCG